MGPDERRDVKPLLSKEWLGTHPPDVLRLNPLATPLPWPCTLACSTLRNTGEAAESPRFVMATHTATDEDTSPGVAYYSLSALNQKP